jgi:hypothetical protein
MIFIPQRREAHALFWVIKQGVEVIPYGRFETTCRSHLQFSALEESTDMLSRNVGKELALLLAA